MDKINKLLDAFVKAFFLVGAWGGILWLMEDTSPIKVVFMVVTVAAIVLAFFRKEARNDMEICFGNRQQMRKRDDV